MLFPTLNFGLFFLIVFAVSWGLVGRSEVRKGFLLAASYFFYGYWDWRFLSLLAFSSSINYLAGIALSRTADAGTRKLLVGLAVAANLIILGFFKYYDFFTESLSDLLISAGLQRDLPLLDVILPIGISFFTFQGISYVVDVYRKNIPAVDGPLDIFLYISFFPQLVAGPIVRAADFLPQLRNSPSLEPATLTFGFTLILVGLFKKMIVASYLATEIVDDVFAFPAGYSSLDLLVGTYAFVVQIYCDFSGYSDIAIGLAALLGYRFKRNFDRPLSASTLQDLWQRWHISLTSWLRDYLYRPLRGKKRGQLHTYRNIFLTMLIAGLWHGAAWTFVVWGGMQGVVLVVERLVRSGYQRLKTLAGTRNTNNPLRKELSAVGRLETLAGWFITFNIFALSGIFFRSPDMETVAAYTAGLTTLTMVPDRASPFVILLIAASVALQFVRTDLVAATSKHISNFGPLRLGAALGVGLLVIEMLGPSGVAPFIYFQF